MIIRPETDDDFAAIRSVNSQAFDTPGEADLVDTLRREGYAELSLVAEERGPDEGQSSSGKIVGHILFSPLTIHTNSGDVPAVALAPMAVRPDHQRQGIGSELVTEGLRICRQRGHKIVIVLGHPNYYPRFGFSPELAKPLQAPFTGAAWMALELQPGALRGIAGQVEYAPPFGIENGGV